MYQQNKPMSPTATQTHTKNTNTTRYDYHEKLASQSRVNGETTFAPSHTATQGTLISLPLPLTVWHRETQNSSATSMIIKLDNMKSTRVAGKALPACTTKCCTSVAKEYLMISNKFC
eukprot:m.336989 g.336989  ORF g.336989 m.336989 type:complete len:117 (-) comp16079_c0_seq1:4722-5072(-)